MSEPAAVDRFEGDQAVLLLGEGDQRLVVARAQLPPGTKEGDWLRVELEKEALVAVEPDPEATAAAKARIAAKLQALRRGNQLGD